MTEKDVEGPRTSFLGVSSSILVLLKSYVCTKYTHGEVGNNGFRVLTVPQVAGAVHVPLAQALSVRISCNISVFLTKC
jgi:hypothetical protein